jgi:hypothetical protein
LHTSTAGAPHASPPLGRRLRRRHHRRILAHFRCDEQRRPLVLGEQQLRPAGHREYCESAQPRGREPWSRWLMPCTLLQAAAHCWLALLANARLTHCVRKDVSTFAAPELWTLSCVFAQKIHRAAWCPAFSASDSSCPLWHSQVLQLLALVFYFPHRSPVQPAARYVSRVSARGPQSNCRPARWGRGTALRGCPAPGARSSCVSGAACPLALHH